MKASIVKLVIALLILLLGSCIASGQTKQLLSYRDSLDVIQKLAGGEAEAQRDTVVRIRTGIELWLRSHPDTKVQLEAATQQPSDSEQILKEAKLLRDTVEDILKEDGGQSFDLGLTKISVPAEASPISPVTDSIDHSQISDLHITNVAQAFQYLPGVALDRQSLQIRTGVASNGVLQTQTRVRSQTGIMIHGFDTRQVGLYLDGIPIYYPYDGYADLSRFLASDFSVIEVTKGYSSPLLGPNGLGGTVNLVTRQPEKKLEADAMIGTGSGSMLESGIHVGSRLNDKLFIRGGMDWLQSDFFPLSDKFSPNSAQPTFNRLNSGQRDVRYNGRIGWTPKGQDQYVFTYNKQKSDFDVPDYAGYDIANNPASYSRYEYWNRDSYYFHSNTVLPKKNSVKVRAFYDKYPNGLSLFSDAAHTTWTSFNPNKDYSWGFSAELSSQMIPYNALGMSFFLKDDVHKERTISYNNGIALNYEPWQKDEDRLASFGFQDAFTFFSKIHATIGLSMDHLSEISAQDVSPNNSLIPFPCAPGRACALHNYWTFNPLLSLSYSVSHSGTLFFTLAKRSHFPTLEDRYSNQYGYATGTTYPNPDLKPEQAENYTLGYSHAFALNTVAKIELFRSHVYHGIADTYVVDTTCAGKLCRKTVNTAVEVHKGTEFTISSSPIRHLNLAANYTYLERIATFIQRISPQHRAVAAASYSLPEDILLFATFRYEGGAYTFETSNTVVPPSPQYLVYPASRFGTLDLGTTIPGYAGVKFEIGAKNLLDRNYYYQEGYPEAGRTWYLNMRYRY
jgi:iron complex outermembrane recepter protein